MSSTSWILLQVLAGLSVNPTVPATLGARVPSATRATLNRILEERRYDTNVWPTFGLGPTNVIVNLHVNSFGSINAANMDYTVDIFLRQQWHDSRLAYPAIPGVESLIFSRNEVLTQIWKPDLFFQNVKEAHMHSVTSPNQLLRIDPSGNVLYSMRVTLKLSCPMELEHFPFDEQVCHINMSSFAFPESVIQFHWLPERPVTLNPDMELPQFDLVGFDTYEGNWSSEETGSFSTLTLEFFLARQNEYHLIQTYLPTILIVMISWVSFWLDPNAIPGRVTLGVTTLLTLTTLASGVRTQLPPVSYLKGIDVWIGVCTVYVFGVLLEFTFVNFLARKKQDPENKPLQERMRHLLFAQTVCVSLQHGMPAPSAPPENVKTYIDLAKRIDRYSRILFPVSFLVINLVYWPYYLTAAGVI